MSTSSGRADNSDVLTDDRPPANGGDHDPPTPPSSPPTGGGVLGFVTSDRCAAWAFVAFLVVAAALLLGKYGTYRWFAFDEWDYLADRSATDVHDLVRDHNGHWTTLPILVFQGLYSVFGLRSYLPYQATVVLLHLTVALLLRTVMRRSGVGGWLATAAAAPLVLYGPGNDNIVWAFQIGFTGSVAFALGQMLLAEGDRPLDRRDVIGLGLGFAALMCSGQAPPMIAATGLVCLLRRGWRVAAFHTVPLGVTFAIWYAVFQPPNPVDVTPTLEHFVVWIRSGTVGNFEALGQHGILALLLVVLLFVGLALAWHDLGRRTFFRRGAMPLALLLMLVGVQLASFPTRWFLGAQGAIGPRYLYVFALLTLPALGFAAQAIVDRRRVALPALMVLFVLPIPWYLDDFAPPEMFIQVFENMPDRVVKLAVAPEATRVPPSVRPSPSPYELGETTIGWLVATRESGRLPDIDPEPEIVNDTQIPLRLGFAQYDEDVPAGLTCRETEEPTILSPPVGTTISLLADTYVNLVDAEGNNRTWPVLMAPRVSGKVFRVHLPDLHLRFTAPIKGTSYVICT